MLNRKAPPEFIDTVGAIKASDVRDFVVGGIETAKADFVASVEAVSMVGPVIGVGDTSVLFGNGLSPPVGSQPVISMTNRQIVIRRRISEPTM